MLLLLTFALTSRHNPLLLIGWCLWFAVRGITLLQIIYVITQ
jgi:hypothetical protein